MTTTTNGPADPYALVAEHWPYDGPHSPDTVASALTAAAELIRYANNATQNRGLLSLPDLPGCVGSLHTLGARLPQLLDQLADTLDRQTAKARDHRGDEADPAIADAVEAAATEAAELLRVPGIARAVGLAHALSTVQSRTSFLAEHA